MCEKDEVWLVPGVIRSPQVGPAVRVPDMSGELIGAPGYVKPADPLVSVLPQGFAAGQMLGVVWPEQVKRIVRAEKAAAADAYVDSFERALVTDPHGRP